MAKGEAVNSGGASRFEILVESLLDGRISVEGEAELIRYLRSDASLVTVLAQTLLSEQALEGVFLLDRSSDDPDWLAAVEDAVLMSSLVDEAIESRRRHEIEEKANQLLASQQARERSFSRFRGERSDDAERNPRQAIVIPKILAVVGVAAAVLLAAWIGWPEPEAVDTTLPAGVAEDRDSQAAPEIQVAPPVATLLRTYGAVWRKSGPDGSIPQIGSRLRQGVYVLDAGAIQIAFDQGAAVIIEAPAEFELLDGNAGRLTRGQLVAQVPVSAHGFQIDTPTAEIVDLGTEFGVRVLDVGHTEMMVFDGEIAAGYRDAAGQVGTRHHMHRGEVARVSGSALDVLDEDAALDGLRFARDWSSAQRPVEVSAGVRYVYEPPASLVSGAFVSEMGCMLIPETWGVLLRRSLSVELAVTGGEQVVVNEWTPRRDQLPEGTRVDSYLLHIDRSFDATDVVTRTGRITFPQPIVALVFDARTLTSTDRLLGLAKITYATGDSKRGLIGEGPE
ncbi:MAG: FecR domain-containing protein, partial [Phycisphaerales bacterium JB063]